MRTKPILSAKQLTPLIEIIIAMVFFAGASIILVQVFAKAHNDSRFAHDINNATLFVGECAEKIRLADNYNGILEVLYLHGFAGSDDGNTYNAFLDIDFSPAQKAEAYSTMTFEAVINDNEAGRLITGRFVCIRKDGIELISLGTATFLPGEEV